MKLREATEFICTRGIFRGAIFFTLGPGSKNFFTFRKGATIFHAWSGGQHIFSKITFFLHFRGFRGILIFKLKSYERGGGLLKFFAYGRGWGAPKIFPLRNFRLLRQRSPDPQDINSVTPLVSFPHRIGFDLISYLYRLENTFLVVCRDDVALPRTSVSRSRTYWRRVELLHKCPEPCEHLQQKGTLYSICQSNYTVQIR